MVEGCEGNGGVGSTGAAPLVAPAPSPELIALLPPLPVAPLRFPPHFRLVADEL